MEILVYLVIFLLAILGTPLFIVMALFALSAFHFAGVDSSVVSIAIYQVSDQMTLLTIPLFTFAGQLMADSKSPQRMLRLSQSLFGHLPGGISIMGIVVCAFFTAFTGASGVTIVALGALLVPMLMKIGHDEKFSIGLITTCGSVGLLFPPSLPIILYGVVARVDIDQLFKAGIGPGCVIMIVLGSYAILKSQKTKQTTIPFNIKEILPALKGAFWEALLPIGVLGGIYGGFTTAAETAAMTAIYVLFIECFIYKDLDFFKDVPKVVEKSMSLVGGILLILCCAMGLTDYLVDEQIPMKILAMMKTYISSKWVFLFVLNIFLLIVGAMMDIFSAIIVVVPLILPMAQVFDVHPIHLAMIFLTNLEIGYITPPVGINLFISSFRFNKPITLLYSYCVPYLLLMILALVIVTYLPALTLFWF